MFVAKIYHVPDLNDLMKTLVPYDVSFALYAAKPNASFAFNIHFHLLNMFLTSG